MHSSDWLRMNTGPILLWDPVTIDQKSCYTKKGSLVQFEAVRMIKKITQKVEEEKLSDHLVTRFNQGWLVRHTFRFLLCRHLWAVTECP